LKYLPASVDVSGRALRAARANPVFGTDEKRIRTKNTVMDKSNKGLDLLLYGIAHCVRTASRPRNIAIC
jgi:hypothetical protein